MRPAVEIAHRRPSASVAQGLYHGRQLEDLIRSAETEMKAGDCEGMRAFDIRDKAAATGHLPREL